MSPTSTAELVTLGCRLNIAESETIRALLGRRDAVVVNTCAVTAEAMRRSRAAVRRARRERPSAEIVVTGCAAEIDRAGFAAMPEVDRIVANADKLSPAAWGNRRVPAPARGDHARAFVPIQNGCDHRCTFCVIPHGRGASRSRPIAAVIEAVAGEIAAGRREVVLTGVDLTSYGADLADAPTLGLLVERLLEVPGLQRLRLSSLDGIEIDERLFALLAGEPRVMPHVHLSLQAGDDMVLRRMRRRHRRADAVALTQRLLARRPEVAIGADLIAGFPTETDAMFARTLALVDDCTIVHAHIFPYSPRPGTPAARMPQVDPVLVRERAGRLRGVAAGRRAAWLRGLVGSNQDVLVEKPGDRGHAGNFADVRLATPAAPVGAILRVRVTAATDTHLIGTPQ